MELLDIRIKQVVAFYLFMTLIFMPVFRARYYISCSIDQVINQLACVTEQTHDIRVYGLCHGARISVP